MSNEIVLDFHDSLLRQSDLDLLNGPHWLNDNHIAFYFEYLERVAYENSSKDVAFVSPSVAQLMKNSQPEEIVFFCEPLHLDTKQFVFFPVNDSESPDTPGGSHWSLLAYHRAKNVYLHFDSSEGNTNNKPATKLLRNVAPFIVKNESFPTLTEGECDKQQNGYDCGVYVLCNVERLCEMWIGKGKYGNSTSHTDAVKKRTDMIQLIRALRK